MEKYELQRLRSLPIEQVAERLGIQVARHKSLCPFHDDHHASLAFNARKNLCRCYVCMDHGMGTIDLVMRLTGKDFRSACQWLADAGGVYLAAPPQGSQRKEEPAPTPTFDASRYAPFFEHPWLSDAARRFLFGERRIDPRVAAWCRLTSWTDRGGTHWLQTPYFATDGRLIGIQNRNLGKGSPGSKDAAPGDKDSPRFRFPRGSRCGIYNQPIARRLAPGDSLYITEGCSDCWAMLSAGHKAIAIPSATLLSDDDRQWLAALGERLRLHWHMYPDRDAPGERLFMQLRQVLPSLEHHQLPPGCKDFSDYYLSRQ